MSLGVSPVYWPKVKANSDFSASRVQRIPGRLVCEGGAASLSLVVGQGIHRVKDEGAHPCPQFALPKLLIKVQEDGIEEGLSLAAPGARRDDHVSPHVQSFDRFLLVLV